MEQQDIEKSAAVKGAHINENHVQIPDWDRFEQNNQVPQYQEPVGPPPSRPGFSTSAFTSKLNRVFPRDKRYISLKRRTFFIVLVALVLALLALIIGLAVGLSSKKHGAGNLPLPGGATVYTGDLTYYEPGLGACGVTSSNSDSIVAISHITFDAASTSANPNANPLCGRRLRATRGGKSVDLTVVDRCVGCQPTDLDVTVNTFSELADTALGRVAVSWAWL